MQQGGGWQWAGRQRAGALPLPAAHTSTPPPSPPHVLRSFGNVSNVMIKANELEEATKVGRGGGALGGAGGATNPAPPHLHPPTCSPPLS